MNDGALCASGRRTRWQETTRPQPLDAFSNHLHHLQATVFARNACLMPRKSPPRVGRSCAFLEILANLRQSTPSVRALPLRCSPRRALPIDAHRPMGIMQIALAIPKSSSIEPTNCYWRGLGGPGGTTTGARGCRTRWCASTTPYRPSRTRGRPWRGEQTQIQPTK